MTDWKPTHEIVIKKVDGTETTLPVMMEENKRMPGHFLLWTKTDRFYHSMPHWMMQGDVLYMGNMPARPTTRLRKMEDEGEQP